MGATPWDPIELRRLAAGVINAESQLVLPVRLDHVHLENEVIFVLGLSRIFEFLRLASAISRRAFAFDPLVLSRTMD